MNIKPYLYRGKTLVLCKPEAIKALCFIENWKLEHLKEVIPSQIPRSIGYQRVKNAHNNMVRDKLDWIKV